MNKQEADILKTILNEHLSNQRLIAKVSGHSLGVVNQSLKALIADNYLNLDFKPTNKAITEFRNKTPNNAIILAAGFGMRMIPINQSTPKALIEVKGETLIERIIKQLHSVGVNNISIVVGFMKECFEYLIDEYGVELVVNPDYAIKNNLSSLALVVDKISNTYIIPSDIWCSNNPFDSHEMYSWYMVSNAMSSDSSVRVNRKKELVKTGNYNSGNRMIGISYLSECDAVFVKEKIKECASSNKNDNSFWEIVLFEKEKMIIPAKVINSSDVVEINTYEQLREFDNESNQLKSNALDVIASVFNVSLDKIVNISVLKKGMTNRSFRFSINGENYIMRIPGEGTDQLINRENEALVYKTIRGLGFCDDPIYINPANGYKITKYLEGIRVCNPNSTADLKRCMGKLRLFHSMKLLVPHTFDIFGQIDFYESLWQGKSSIFKDYRQTKENIFKLKPFIDNAQKEYCLTHIDAVPDNFLFYKPKSSMDESLQLTDWEYSGMQDPHVDIAMFCIYSMYDKSQIDRLIDIYFQKVCDRHTRIKIYCYIAICGLLWSNWCEYKRNLGIEFGEYALRQYRFAKDYYLYATKEMDLK